MKKPMYIILALICFIEGSSFADNFNVIVKGTLKYYDTESKTNKFLEGIEVQVWDSDVPDASTIVDDYMGSGITDNNGYFEIACAGGDPFNYSYSRPDVYLRVVMKNSTGLVRLTDELNFTQTYVIGLHENDNVEGIVDFGTHIINSGVQAGYGTKMMVFQGASHVWQDFVDNAGLPPSGYYDIVYWSGVYIGTPWTNLNTTHWPIGYPIYNMTTCFHEFGHTIRHCYDGNQAHWDWDDTRFIYGRYHFCKDAAWGATEEKRKGFAFNEGWAEFWEGECECTLSSGDMNNMECEGNIAKALCELSVLLPNKKWDMIKVLKANPGTIHSYEEFFDKATMIFPSLIGAIHQSVSGISTNKQINPLTQSLQLQIVKSRIAKQVAYEDSLLQLLKKSKVEADIRFYPCEKGDCEGIFQTFIRPHILNSEIQISNIVVKQLQYNLENYQVINAKFKDGNYDKWYNKNKLLFKKKICKIIYNNLTNALKAARKVIQQSKDTQVYTIDIKQKIEKLRLLMKTDLRNIPVNLDPLLAWDDKFIKTD